MTRKRNPFGDDVTDFVIAGVLVVMVYKVFGARIGAMLRGTTQDAGDTLPANSSAPSDVTVTFGE